LESKWRQNVAEAGMDFSDWELFTRVLGPGGGFWIARAGTLPSGTWYLVEVLGYPGLPALPVEFNRFPIPPSGKFPLFYAVDPDH